MAPIAIQAGSSGFTSIRLIQGAHAGFKSEENCSRYSGRNLLRTINERLLHAMAEKEGFELEPFCGRDPAGEILTVNEVKGEDPWTWRWMESSANRSLDRIPC